MDIQAAFDQFERDGYCLLEAILDQGQADKIDQVAQSLMAHQQGYAKLEGALSVLPDLVDLCIHADVLSIADRFLGSPFYLCNNACMMWCQPGAPGGQIHADWPLGDVPQPYPSWPMLLQTMWMLTEFTEDNGGTRLVPGSHKSLRPPRAEDVQHEVPVVGPAGSVLIWHGGIWHRNGANITLDRHRMGANIAYIPRCIHRPRDAWPLIKPSLYLQFPLNLQRLLERSVE